MIETQRPLGISMRCYCGNENFSIHTMGKLGYMARCTECKKRYTLSNEENEDRLSRPSS